MDEKIAKVREVVHNTSTNDIVLALHHFDLDVEKTIHAFLQGGCKEALGSWERTGGSASKKNKQKKNKSTGNVQKTNATHNNSSSSNVKPAVAPVSNGFSNGYSSVSSTSVTQSVLSNGNVEQTGSSSTSSYVPTSNNKVANGTGGVVAAKKAPKANNIQPVAVSNEEIARFQGLDDAAKTKAVTNETDELAAYGAELDKLQNVLNNELSLSQSNVLRCIQEIKQVLAERERQLCADLVRCRDDALEFFSARRAKLQELNKQAKTAKSGKERDNLFKNLKAFNAAKANDQQIAYLTRFIYDNSKVFNAINHFGEVIPVQAARADNHTKTHHVQEKHHHEQKPQKKVQQNGSSVGSSPNHQGKENGLAVNGNGHFSPGHSSIVSSVGEESSDLSQISPVPVQKTAKVAQLANNGIVMQSDALSTDQLADIQKRIEETLRSQGIDPSVLTEIGVNTVVPRRRPPPGSGGKNGGDKTRKAGGPANRGPNGHSQKPKVKLSILE